MRITDNKALILKFLKKPMTANECIQKIFENDIKNDRAKDRSWKFYVHLNKLFAPLNRDGIIEKTGTKIGPTNREEKIWKRA